MPVRRAWWLFCTSSLPFDQVCCPPGPPLSLGMVLNYLLRDYRTMGEHCRCRRQRQFLRRCEASSLCDEGTREVSRQAHLAIPLRQGPSGSSGPWGEENSPEFFELRRVEQSKIRAAESQRSALPPFSLSRFLKTSPTTRRRRTHQKNTTGIPCP